jgi:hypothetical protein
VALEAHALRNLEARDDAPLDLLARRTGSFARSSVSSPLGLIEVGNESVATQVPIEAGPAAFRESLRPAVSDQ